MPTDLPHVGCEGRCALGVEGIDQLDRDRQIVARRRPADTKLIRTERDPGALLQDADSGRSAVDQHDRVADGANFKVPFGALDHRVVEANTRIGQVDVGCAASPDPERDDVDVAFADIRETLALADDLLDAGFHRHQKKKTETTCATRAAISSTVAGTCTCSQMSSSAR
jgi:hypothetical protein